MFFFLAEAFTKAPRRYRWPNWVFLILHYVTWRTQKKLTDYFTELTQTMYREFFSQSLPTLRTSFRKFFHRRALPS